MKTKALSVFSSIHKHPGNKNDLHHNRLPLEQKSGQKKVAND